MNNSKPANILSRHTQTLMFYDGGCPLCSREVKHYQRLDYAQRIAWVDISRDSTLLNAFGIPFETGMQRLHVLTSDGRLVDGAYAFAAIWSQLPYYRFLASFLYGIRALAPLDAFYSRFARWRYRQRCKTVECVL